MGSRNIQKKETKKQKKDNKKTPQIGLSDPVIPVEVIGKHKKKDREEI